MKATVYTATNREEIEAWLQHPFWEWMFTGTGESSSTADTLEKTFARWRTTAAQETGLQIASIGVFSSLDGPHIHCLLVGWNRGGKTLSDISNCSIQALERAWKNLTHRPAKISVAYDDKLSAYAANHLLYNPTQQIISAHNLKLLRKLEKTA